ncbi:MAG: DUF4175 domain-containing protein [Pseudomonadota bacterium]
MTQTTPDEALKRIAVPLRLTLLGLWAEALTRAFWPLWSVLILGLGLAALGVQDHLPLEADWAGLVLGALGLIWGVAYALRSFRKPTRDQALARLDQTLPGQPIAALRDSLAMGAQDPATQALWAAHRTRMAQRASTAQAVEPDLRLASRDPYALRYMALMVLVLALIFGSIWRVSSLATLPAPGSADQVAAGPAWEGWATPPAYTGKPALYLNDQTGPTLTLPAGTRLKLRFYGTPGALILAETVSGRTDVPAASDPAQDFGVLHSGRVTIEGAGGRSWAVSVLPDAPPAIAAKGPISRDAEGRFQQAFEATDDYGVTKGWVAIALDLPAVDRRYGLSLAPEPSAPVVLDLPLPMTRERTLVTQVLVDDLSKDRMANLPVTLIFTAADAAGQKTSAAPVQVVLPGRRFFDPLAAAVVEMRRDLLWNRANAPRVVEVLKALTYKPEGLLPDQKAYLRLRVLIADLDKSAAQLDTAKRDTFAEEMWSIALLIEDGGLSSAFEAMKRAQDRLSEAIRNGASPAEIDRLMQEMRQALDTYMAQEAQKNAQGADEPNQPDPNSPKITQDQLQAMLDQLQSLMQQGRTAEAQDLMQKLRDMMNTMKVTQGDGTGKGQGSSGQQAMKNLGQTLRDQQKLSDDSFHDLQNGRPGGQAAPDGESLADRQKRLKDHITQLRRSGTLPGAGDPNGTQGRSKLDEAGRAMDEAEKALRQGDLPQALDKQAQALESLRQGIQHLGDAIAQNQAEPDPNAQQASPQAQRDPLGRDGTTGTQMAPDHSLLQGQDVYRRAQDLLDEIRKRAGQQARPDQERSYLKRLLDLF